MKNPRLKTHLITLCSGIIFFGNSYSQNSVKRLCPEDEPGIPFTLTITVMDLETKAPIQGAQVYAYHTNHLGDYEEDETGKARIQGTAVSDPKGKVEFKTIYPRGYNNSSTGEHIHFKVNAEGYDQTKPTLIFADYYKQRYNFNNPELYKVYLKDLVKIQENYTGQGMIYLKKN